MVISRKIASKNQTSDLPHYLKTKHQIYLIILPDVKRNQPLQLSKYSWKSQNDGDSGCLPFLLGKAEWSTIVVAGKGQIPNINFHGDALVPFLRPFPEGIPYRFGTDTHDRVTTTLCTGTTTQ